MHQAVSRLPRDAALDCPSHGGQPVRCLHPPSATLEAAMAMESAKVRFTSETEVLIVGAGATGLTLALWLQKLGTPFRIVDSQPSAAPFSRALGVHARTLEFDRQLGFADDVVSGCVVMSAVNLWVNRRKTAHLTLSDLGS